MARQLLIVCLTAVVVSVAAPVGAGAIEDRVNDHIEAAVNGGVRPADFHHLFMAFAWRGTLRDWSDAERNLDRLSGVRRVDPLMVDEMRLIRARLSLDRGLDAAARELFRTMGGLSSWWFEGPVHLEELQDFDRLAVPPPADIEWRAVPGTDPLGWVRLSGLAWPPRRQMAYLATTVISSTEQPVAVRVGTAQVARAWLNGSEVVTTPQPMLRGGDQVAGGAWLRQGRNLVVVAVASENDRWWLRVRLTRPNGSMLDDVREVHEPPVDRVAVERKPPVVRELGTEIRKAVESGTPGASMALAAYLVAHRPEPESGGGIRAACRAARTDAPGEARLLEWMVTSDAGAARDLLLGAVAADPDLLWARLELAGWYGERGLFEEAHGLLGEADGDEAVVRGATLDLDAGLWGAVVLPAVGDLGRTYPRCVRVNLSVAEGAIQARRWDLATEAALRLEDLTPGSAAIIDLRKRLAESCGDGDALRDIFAIQLARDPNRAEVRIRLARLLAADEDLEGARNLIGEGLQRSPGNVELIVELAGIEHSSGDDVRAATLAREALELRPQDRRAQRLLELLGERSESLDWLRTLAELWQMADAAAPDGHAVALLDHRETRFLPSNLTEERVQLVFFVHAADRADDLLTHRLPFIAESERLRVLRARILRRDGSEVTARQGNTPRLSEPEFSLYYDTRLRVLSFTNLEDGDLIEIAYILTEIEESNETGPYNGGLIRLGRGVPIALMELELAGPEALMPTWELVHLEGEPTLEEGSDGVRHLRWRWRDLPMVESDVPPAPQLMVMPYLVYSNHPDWGSLADWYARHVAPRVRVSEQVQETAQRLVGGLDDRLDRINRIYRFVTNEIRYVGLEFGEHHFRPFSADWVLHHRIGDCKDKAALLVALYDAIGVPARMVMVRTNDLGPVSNETAVLEIFNHAIAYLPEDNLWLDGTAAGHAPYPPPTGDQDAVVLVVDGAESRPQTTPAVGGGLARSKFTLSLGEDGVVELAIRTDDTGEAADLRRVRFAGSRENQRVSRWLQELFPGAQLTGKPKLQLRPGRDPTIMEVEGTVTRSALQSSGGIGVFPGSLEWAASMVPGGTRHGPLMVAVRPDLEWTLEVDLGRPPGSLPEAIDLDTSFGSLRVEINAQAMGYRVEGFLHLEAGLIEAREVVDLREFLIAVERHLGRRLESP
jgi:transglutaminase-like putative cysteine protease